LSINTFDTNASSLINNKSFFYSPDSAKLIFSPNQNSVYSFEDTLKIQYEKPFLLKSENLLGKGFDNFIIKKDDLNFLDYRYTGNYFSNSQFGFVRDLGSLGQPNEILIYGQGFGSISFLNDGININNRLFNSLDLNLFQSESIDSIEVIPFSRGFLYGTNNNPISLNFIPKEFKTNIPYTRIKFYQAPYEEGMFDGIFSSNFTNKLSTYFQITHYSTDPRYRNSEYGSWQVLSRARYLPSDDVSLLGTYHYSRSNIQLNGGVNADSIKNIFSSNQFEDILFNNIQAPVNFINRYQKVSLHNANIKALISALKKHPTELTFYYQSSLNEFRQNENNRITNYQPGVESIVNNNEFSTIGIQIKQNINLGFLRLQSYSNSERTLFYTPHPMLNKKINTFATSLVGESEIILGNFNLVPSFYGKYTFINNISYNGFGFDLRTTLNKIINIYAGVSRFDNPYYFPIYHTDNQKIEYTNAEVRTSLNLGSSKFSMGYIHQNANSIVITNSIRLNAVNLEVDLNFWKLNFSINSSYYFSKKTQRDYRVPEFTISGGVYFIDTLFSSNLYLKTGMNIKSFGSRYYTYIDFEKYMTSSRPFNSVEEFDYNRINPTTQVDFFLTGQIQKNATIYFVFENILNKKYYLVQYYPMYERGIRFGIVWEFFN